MANKVERVADPLESDEKKLFALQQTCAFPGCDLHTIDLDEFGNRTIVAEIAHILPARPTGPRADPAMDYTDPDVRQQIRGFDNLVLLCAEHHTIVDTNFDDYTAAMLLEWKAASTRQANQLDEDELAAAEQAANDALANATAAATAAAIARLEEEERAAETAAEAKKPWLLAPAWIGATFGVITVAALIPGVPATGIWAIALAAIMGAAIALAWQRAIDPQAVPWLAPTNPLPAYAGAVAIVIICGGLLAFWAPDPDAEPIARMPAGAGNNIAVFPFGGEDDTQAVSGALADEAERRLDDTWNVEGPDWVDDDFPGDPDDLLRERRVDIALYGSIEDGLQANAWLTSTAAGASLSGVIGPIELCCSGITVRSNITNSARADILAEQLDHWATLAEFLEVLQNLTCDSGCLAADDALSTAMTDLLLPLSDRANVSHEIQHLSRGFLASSALLRRQFNDDSSLPQVMARDGALLQLSRTWLEQIIEADDAPEATRARAYIALAATVVGEQGCSSGADESGMSEADQHIDSARALVPASGQDDPSELAVRVGLAEASLAWCRWSSDTGTAAAATAALDDVIAEFEDRDEEAQQRVSFLVATAYVQRAEIRAAEGIPGAAADYDAAMQFVPPLFEAKWSAERDTVLEAGAS